MIFIHALFTRSMWDFFLIFFFFGQMNNKLTEVINTFAINV